jgi:allantoate deiminase
VSAPDPAFGRAVQARLDALAELTDEPGRLTRLYLSPAHRKAVLAVKGWMEQAGMVAGLDAAATVVGRYEGAEPGRPAVLLGSHIDTVRDAGRYDGMLGVLAAIEAVGALHAAGERLPFALEVLAFGDEEGVRFPSTLAGSRALAGTFDPTALDGRDSEGVSLRGALQAFGCDPSAVAELARDPAAVLAYLELHIEQGPVLEQAGLPLGIVTAIDGARRYRATVGGEAGHAGTVPMALRRDALAAAAEMVLAIEQAARANADLVATVGLLETLPGAVNVIPGAVRFTIDMRAPADGLRDRVAAALEAELGAIARRRGVELRLERSYEMPAAPCDPGLIAALAAAVERQGLRPLQLPSGAGHDAMAMAPLCPIGMLFLRCKGGISHNPAEFSSVEDIDLAVRALLDLLRRFSVRPAG